MHVRTRSQKPVLALGLEQARCRKKLQKIIKVIDEVEDRREGCGDVGDAHDRLLEKLEGKAQLGEEATPHQLGGEKTPEPEPNGKETSLEVDSEAGVDTPVVTMAQEGGGGVPPPNPPIDPLVRPRGLPIVVPRNLVAVDMPSNLPKFWGTKDEDPSRHMERYIERLASSLITDHGYWLVWFPTTLEGEAYEWYRDHPEGHFRGWEQMQRDFLNEFRSEVGQSTALRALASLKQGRDEEISAYIRRFDLVCTRFVGTMLNDDTLKQFFIQGFFKAYTI